MVVDDKTFGLKHKQKQPSTFGDFGGMTSLLDSIHTQVQKKTLEKKSQKSMLAEEA